MTLKQFLPVLVLLTAGQDAPMNKDPKYVMEKLNMANGYDQSYRMLDVKNMRTLLRYITKMRLEDMYTTEELEEIGLIAGSRY